MKFCKDCGWFVPVTRQCMQAPRYVDPVMGDDMWPFARALRYSQEPDQCGMRAIHFKALANSEAAV